MGWLVDDGWLIGWMVDDGWFMIATVILIYTGQ